MSKNDYEGALQVLDSLESETIKAPDIPVDVYVQEAENLYLVAKEDKDLLVSAGLDWEKYIGRLLPVAGALRHAQSVLIKSRIGESAVQKEWKSQLLQGKKLRSKLISTFRYAYRKRPELVRSLRELSRGSGEARLIQVLHDLCVLGKANEKELAEINFETSQLKTVASFSNEMLKLRALVNKERLRTESKDMRDRAFTFLKEAVDEIRAAGKYAFRDNLRRSRLYASAYKRG